MTSYVTYNGIPITCPACGTSHTDVSMHIKWVNRHGASVRIFCNVCGVWTDRKRTDAGGLVDTVVPHAIPHPSYADRVFENEGSKAR